MPENPRETFRRLHAIATCETATAEERENARRVMDRYIAKYGAEVSIPETEPQIERRVTYESEYESRLAIHCAEFAGCESHQLGRFLYRGRSNEKFRSDGTTKRFSGSESAVLSAVELYEHHRAKLAELFETVENGYRFAAMPLPPVEGGKSGVVAPHLAAALRAAQNVGRTHSLTNTLPATTGKR